MNTLAAQRAMRYAKPVIAALLAAGFALPDRARSAESCPDIVKYVCAVKDGTRVTYTNSCFARGAGAANIVLGKCENEAASQMQFCPEQMIPVCASKNGEPTTYGNACIAIADGVTILHKGNC
jgi:hypothetical protein